MKRLLISSPKKNVPKKRYPHTHTEESGRALPDAKNRAVVLLRQEIMEERAVKPKTTKAERRALQERQRAEKAAKMGGEQGPGAASLPGVKPGHANAPTAPSAGQVVSCHMVHMS